MKIGIIGLGLIGGSLLKALADKGFEIFAVTGNADTLEKARRYCSAVSHDISVLSDCEVVFASVPMSETVNILHKLETVLPETAVVTDVSSLKSFVMKEKYKFNFVGSHPMAGTEFSGFDNSDENMFDGAKWVITPYPGTDKKVLEKLENVILKTGAAIVYANAEEHDIAAAKISHMPMLIAQALFSAVKDDDLALKLASSGFRDMTRLAMSNVDMAEDMLNMNTENIENALKGLNQAVNDLKQDYKAKISELKKQRQAMYDKNGKNKI